jgi:uncharacterized protein (TIGR02722 family)
MKKVVQYSMWAACLGLGGLMAGCSSVSVERNSAEQQKELSGKWNANDSKLVSQKMIKSMIEGPWVDRATQTLNGKPPRVIVGSFRNQSHELINVDTFVSDIEGELIRSGRVEFVASKKERDQIRDERLDQEFNSSEDTRKESGQEAGADFMLTGTMNSFVEKEGKTENIQYQIDLTLIEIKTNRKVWVDSQKHAKTVSRSRFGF